MYHNTPAAKAGLRVDDVITRFNNILIEDHDHLINLVSLSGVNRRTPLSVMRGGRQIAVDVVLTDRSELQQRSELPASRPDMGIPVRRMGLTVHEMESDVARQLGYAENANGLLVLKVDSSGPLHGRINLYDVIEEVARRPVQSVADLRTALEETGSQGKLAVRVRRVVDGENQSHVILWNR